MRGGYARTHDYAFLNIALNIVSSFPYVAAINRIEPVECVPADSEHAGRRPAGLNPNTLTRTVVGEDFRAPYRGSVQPRVPAAAVERIWSMRVGYVGTLGKDLFQTLDGNPRLPLLPVALARPVRVLTTRAASSAYAPTKPSRGITRCRPASTSGLAVA